MFSPLSKSTKVSEVQSFWRSSSRVTTSPALFEQQNQNLKGLLLKLDLDAVPAELARPQAHLEIREAKLDRRDHGVSP